MPDMTTTMYWNSRKVSISVNT